MAGLRWRRRRPCPTRSSCTSLQASASRCTSRTAARCAHRSTRACSRPPPRQHGLRLRLERRRHRLRPRADRGTGGSRDYRLYADTAKLGATLISDFGGRDGRAGERRRGDQRGHGPDRHVRRDRRRAGRRHLHRATLRRRSACGAQVDVHVPGAGAYRDFTLLLQDADQNIGQSHMPYPTEVKGVTTVNYRSGRPNRTNDVNDESPHTAASGTPATPMLKAYVGDPVEVHALVDAGQRADARLQPRRPVVADRSVHPEARADSRPAESAPGELRRTSRGGAGGGDPVGDMFYGDLRRPFTEAACGACSASWRTAAARSSRSTAAAAPAASSRRWPSRSSLRAATRHLAHRQRDEGLDADFTRGNATIHLYVDGNQVATARRRRPAAGRWLHGPDRRQSRGHVHPEPRRRRESAVGSAHRQDRHGRAEGSHGRPDQPDGQCLAAVRLRPQFAGIAFECSLSTGADAYVPARRPRSIRASWTAATRSSSAAPTSPATPARWRACPSP